MYRIKIIINSFKNSLSFETLFGAAVSSCLNFELPILDACLIINESLPLIVVATSCEYY